MQTAEITAQTLLRHTLASLAYRASRVLDGAPTGFESVRAADSTRAAGDILAHLGDLMDWGLSTARGEKAWNPQPSLARTTGRRASLPRSRHSTNGLPPMPSTASRRNASSRDRSRTP